MVACTPWVPDRMAESSGLEQTTPARSALVEFRLLVGPNIYFPRPAARLALDLSTLLALPTDQAIAVAAQLGMVKARPGPAGSAFRQRFAARLVATLVRRLALSGGSSRLAVRARPGAAVTELVVAFPWRHSGRAEALGQGVVQVLDAIDHGADSVAAVMMRASSTLADAPPGKAPQLIRPKIPVVAVTGTNGKTTTSRMLGHVAGLAGTSVGWSSTDGVYINGDLVEPGDYSGPSGAGQVLRHSGVELAVTETARGGILRRGVGVAYNDVSVVTNISADHLGLDGIDTLDQLAEVKAVITKITKSSGWCVLNADDPRTFAMRSGTKGGVWVFTADPHSPSGRAVLDDGGRVTTVLDGWICVLGAGADPQPVVQVTEVPMTLAGLSRANTENALAVTSAALALGYSAEQVKAGLESFLPGENNPGRMNIWSLPAGTGGDLISVVVDLAHNEASLEALLEIMRGVRQPGSRLLLAVGTAGDRGDEVFIRLGELAALGVDHLEIAHKSDYLRGRSMSEIGELLRIGAAGAGLEVAAEHPAELAALQSLVAQAHPGDVVAIMAHQQRAEIDAWLEARGATRDSAKDLWDKVTAARA